ncbi:MAG: hypothetical protein U1F43_10715 [Myxococcota bacterium]
MARPILFALLALVPLPLASCDQLLSQLNNPETAPDVNVGSLELRHGPSIGNLAAYYCPKISSDPIVQVSCRVALGNPPPKSSLSFEFGIVLNLHNPNDVPIPTADVLLALNLFDGGDAEALGAICISMCGTDNPNCDGTPRPGACQARQGDIFTIEDFVSAIPGLIADIASGRAAEELSHSTILAGGDLSLDLAFILGVDQALNVFQKTARAYVDAELNGGNGSLDIPVSAEGTVFFDLPVLGRLGVGYGPFQTTWHVL